MKTVTQTRFVSYWGFVLLFGNVRREICLLEWVVIGMEAAKGIEIYQNLECERHMQKKKVSFDVEARWA